MIERRPVTDNVLADYLAAVVLTLMVALNRLLGCQKVRPAAEGSAAAQHAIPCRGRVDVNAQARDRVIHTGYAGSAVSNSVAEFEVLKANTVGERPRAEIDARGMSCGVVGVQESLQRTR